MSQAKRAAEAAPTFTTAELRAIVVAGFTALGERCLPTLRDVERTDLEVLRATTTQRTVLQVAVDSLNAAGVPTESTVGAVMDRLGMDKDAIHDAVCYCFEGDEMSGDTAAANFGQT